jgi:hypothetical protein
MKSQNLKIYGPLPDGETSFVVHDSLCAAAGDDFDFTLKDVPSRLYVSEVIWADLIDEGSTTAKSGLNDIGFCPCVKIK